MKVPHGFEELSAGVKELNLSVLFTAPEEVSLKMQEDLESHGRNSCLRTQKSFLTNSNTTLVHTISKSEKRAFVEHINTHLRDDRDMKKYIPIDTSTNDLFDIAKDGILLCKLINLAVEGTIDERALNMKEKLNPWERNENHMLCLNSAKAIGCSVVNIGTQDLAEGTPHLVLGLISQFVKIQLLSDINVKSTPELAELLDEMEEFEDLLRLPAEKLLLRWMNFQLRKAGHSRVVNNFSSDVKDSAVYAVLLHELAPESCTLEPLEIADPLARAKAVLSQAERIGCRKYISARDILDGSPNLNLAFVAHLFHKRSGLSLDTRTNTFAELINYNEEDSKEETAFRMWINSLGIEFAGSLLEDVRDGWLLLEVLDKVSPGHVNWKLATRPPIKRPFNKLENCNQAVEICKELKFSLVNVAGNDLVEGNKKLTLAFLWQLMRYQVLNVLRNLRLNGREVSDQDIVQWANLKVKNVGKSSHMESFKDKSLSTGVFFLDLLGAVEPRVINWTLVTKGLNEHEKKQNAIYVISVARKLGCSIFVLWDDIVEVHPKMILTLLASIMLWSLTKKPRISDLPSPQLENGHKVPGES